MSFYIFNVFPPIKNFDITLFFKKLVNKKVPLYFCVKLLKFSVFGKTELKVDNMKNLGLLFACCFFLSAGFSKERTEAISTITTIHSLQLEKEKLDYKATAGCLDLHDKKGNVSAHVFFTAYTKEAKNSNRPITFCFNGGPGSSSAWLHIGFLGPKKIKTDDEGKSSSLPYCLIDNKYTLLDVTDLVFIDPVGTGFSVPDEKVDPSQFYSLQGDISACADFIRDYLTYFNRWLSPKYLIGESYGTTRVSGLCDYLQQSCGINVDGIVLLSLAVDIQSLFTNNLQRYSHYTTIPYITHFPSYAAIAYYHKKIALDKSFDEVIQEARYFAENDYALALLKGDRLTSQEFEDTAKEMAKYSGLSEDLVKRYNLRVPANVFLNELLKDQNLNMGIYDGRVVGFSHGVDQFSMGLEMKLFLLDPSTYKIDGEFTACINSYLREDLGYTDNNSPYIILNKEVHQSWDFSLFLDIYSNLSSCLESSMIMNHALKIFTASGYYDLVTPFCSTHYTIDHLNIPSSYRKRITVKNYEGGHMMYLNPKVLKDLKSDLKKFYQE